MPFENLFQRHQTSLPAASRADLACFLPGLRRADVRLPKGPRAALARPTPRRPAARPAPWIEKDAVAVVVFDQAFVNVHLAASPSRSPRAHVQAAGQGRDPSLIHPHVTRAPVQQLPHCVHLKRSPSRYQGFFSISINPRNSFVAARRPLAGRLRAACNQALAVLHDRRFGPATSTTALIAVCISDTGGKWARTESHRAAGRRSPQRPVHERRTMQASPHLHAEGRVKRGGQLCDRTRTAKCRLHGHERLGRAGAVDRTPLIVDSRRSVARCVTVRAAQRVDAALASQPRPAPSPAMPGTFKLPASYFCGKSVGCRSRSLCVPVLPGEKPEFSLPPRGECTETRSPRGQATPCAPATPTGQRAALRRRSRFHRSFCGMSRNNAPHS